jgi:hypothetical protein
MSAPLGSRRTIRTWSGSGILRALLLRSGKPAGGTSACAQARVERYAVFSQTETYVVLSLVKGLRFQPLQRSRKVIPARRAIRSSSDGHT